jgi:hypothetical protein
MLYISDIDNESFGLSNSASSPMIVKAKVYYAVCHKALNTALVSIKNKQRKGDLISSRLISDISLNGVVYETCWEFVSAFNAMMESDGTTTTTTIPVSTTTTEDITTTTTTNGSIPEGAIKFEGTDDYVVFEDGGELIYVVFET